MEIFTVRHIAATTALVSAALLLTACTDNEKKDSAGSQEASASAGATPGDNKGDTGGKKDEGGQDASKKKETATAPASARPTPPSSDNDGDGYGGACKPVQEGRRLIKVYSVTGAVNNVTAYEAKRRCLDKPGSTGSPLYQVGPARTYPVSDKLTMVLISGDGGKVTDVGHDMHRSISHLKTCAQPEGTGQYPSAEESGEYCHPGNFYDALIENGKIVDLYEIAK
ncbi:hypothetical protein T261_5534 [Streptomyces lydicus]|nr:hypothetical protein T261_5534 [Streptomyces lydicus]